MSSNVTKCHACGHMSEDPEWCDNCGAPLGAEPQGPDGERGWLGEGDTIGVRCRAEALGLEPAGPGVTLELRLEEVFETSSVRHISRARFVSVIEVHGEFDAEEVAGALEASTFTVEELGALLGTRDEELPEELAHLVRLPAGETEHGDHLVRLFRKDRSRTLEQLVLRNRGHLDFHEIREVFGALLDLVEELHERDRLYLRLSPWTLRVNDPEPTSGGGGLGDEPTFPEEGKPPVAAQEASAQEEPTEAALADAPPDEDAEVTSGEEEGQGARHIEAGASAAPLSGEDAFEDDDEEDEGDDGRAEAECGDEAGGEQEEAAEQERAEEGGSDEEADAELGVQRARDQEALSTMLEDGVEAPLEATSTWPGFQSLDYELEEIEPAPARRTALLDGGFRFYTAGEDYEEVPVVVGFSPPEMFGRTRADVGAHCDIFSLGMLLYFLVAGELPPTSVYTRHTPALPARHFRPDFPLGLQTVIGRATRPDPRERFADVASMRETFERACELIEQRIARMREPDAPRIDYAVERHIGITKRLRNPTNQDNVFGARSDDGRFSLIVVADGVSTASYGTGDLASEQLVAVAEARWDGLLETYLSGERFDEFELIYRLLEEANGRIVDYVNEHCFPFEGNPHEVMGTTALVAMIHDGVVTLGSLGDSRTYLQRGTSFEQVTIDHNLWTLSILDGVAADSALSLPHGDALARCLGTFYIEEGRLTAIPPQPDIFRFPVTSGDTLLMTTDGLIDFAGANTLAGEDNILSILLSETNPALATLELVLLANRGGGGDNIGIGIARFM